MKEKHPRINYIPKIVNEIDSHLITKSQSKEIYKYYQSVVKSYLAISNCILFILSLLGNIKRNTENELDKSFIHLSSVSFPCLLSIWYYTPEYTLKPPSTGRTTPVTNPDARSLTRKSIAPINSFKSPKRRIGVPSMIF